MLLVLVCSMFSTLDDNQPFGSYKGESAGYKAALANVMGSFHKDSSTYEEKAPVAFL